MFGSWLYGCTQQWNDVLRSPGSTIVGGCEPFNVPVENWALVHWKSSKCSELLSQLLSFTATTLFFLDINSFSHLVLKRFWLSLFFFSVQHWTSYFSILESLYLLIPPFVILTTYIKIFKHIIYHYVILILQFSPVSFSVFVIATELGLLHISF